MIDRPHNSDGLFDIERHLLEVGAFLSQPDAGVGVFKWSIETNVVQMTDSYLERIGMREAAKQHGLLGLIHASHRNRASREIAQAVSGDNERFESLYRLDSNRNLLEVSLFKGVILRTDGRPVGMFGLVIDVTRIPKLILELGAT